ncbi:MAG: ABC transporter permease [Luteimonas sp.]
MRTPVLLRAMSAELLKLKGTLALWMCLIAPLTVTALHVLQLLVIDLGKRVVPAAHDAWQFFAVGQLTMWAFLMLPLFITLQAALLAGLEHGNRQWKYLLALPVPRHAHYLSKLFALTSMLLLATILLAVLIPAGGLLLSILKPQTGIAGSIPWRFIIENLAAISVAALLITALHTWIAIRWRSFTVSVAVGMVATVAGFLLAQSERFGHWYPWSMPVQVIAGDGQWSGFVVQAGMIGGVAVTLLALWDFQRREFD